MKHRVGFVFNFIAFCVLSIFVVVHSGAEKDEYLNEFAVDVGAGEGSLDRARQLSEHTGCHLQGSVIPESLTDDGLFLYTCHHISKRSIVENNGENDVRRREEDPFSEHPHVRWSEQQKVLKRVKRDFIDEQHDEFREHDVMQSSNYKSHTLKKRQTYLLDSIFNDDDSPRGGNGPLVMGGGASPPRPSEWIPSGPGGGGALGLGTFPQPSSPFLNSFGGGRGRKNHLHSSLFGEELHDGHASINDSSHLNDERWKSMWYLNRGGMLDMNVQEAWSLGFTGRNVSITILDDGIERSHPDLMLNYDAKASYDVNGRDADPSPRYDVADSNKHGTRCAGEVAAQANNSICGVGIAYQSGVGGVRMLDGDVTDSVEAASLAVHRDHIDIYSASWGPDDNGKTVDGPGRLAFHAFIEGVKKGRGGLGSIFVWASGNGGKYRDNCNCDGYTNSIWTLTVSSATQNGHIPWYSELCASTLASTYSSGSPTEGMIVTTDLHHTCTSMHTGTSASAPLAAAIVALTLEANKNLNWRDVQHITVGCAQQANLMSSVEGHWQRNGVGRNFSHSFGYGIMDAGCMVKTATNWRSVSPQLICRQYTKSRDIHIAEKSNSSHVIHIPKKVKGQSSASKVKRKAIPVAESEHAETSHGSCPSAIKYLEHVQVNITLESQRRGSISIYLTSPSGTRSQLVSPRIYDPSRHGFTAWAFMTVHMWEESPYGDWTLTIINSDRSSARLKSWNLILFGTSRNPRSSHDEHDSTNIDELETDSLDVLQQHKDLNQVNETTKTSTSQKKGPVEDLSDNALDPSVSSSSDLTNCKVPITTATNTVGTNSKPVRKIKLCKICDHPYSLFQGRCVHTCPTIGYFTGSEFGGKSCLSCYYTCLTCSGPNDNQCLSCHPDSQLERLSDSQSHCVNRSLLNRIESHVSFVSNPGGWLVLIVVILANILILSCIGLYVVRWRNRKERQLLAIIANSTSVIGGMGNGHHPSSRSTATSASNGRSDLQHNGASVKPYKDNVEHQTPASNGTKMSVANKRGVKDVSVPQSSIGKKSMKDGSNDFDILQESLLP